MVLQPNIERVEYVFVSLYHYHNYEALFRSVDNMTELLITFT